MSNEFVLNLLNGLSFGMILFLLASGLSIVFGLMGILNLAHGALYMVGAYVGWSVGVQYGLNFWVAALAGGLVAGGVGFAMQQGCLKHLPNQLNEQALVTIGIVYILTNTAMWIWGPEPIPAFGLVFMGGHINIGSGTYSLARLGLIGIGLVVFAGLWIMYERTKVGAVVRAGMDNREMTVGLGLNLERVAIGVFFAGAFIAGMSGVLGAQLLGVNLSLSMDVLQLALAVVVIGGTGSILGALVGGLFIGLIDSFSASLFPGLAMFAVYLAMVVILLVRPSGLVGRRV
jgi:branched-chain amino acid transport system permease protein